MSAIVLRDDLIEKLRQIARSENRAIDEVVETLLVQYQAEEAWDEAVLDSVLGDAVSPDGDIDFDKLRASGVTMSLHELYAEGDDVDEA